MSVVARLRLMIILCNPTIGRIFNLGPTNGTEAFSVGDYAITLNVSFENAFTFITGLVFKARGKLSFFSEIIPPLLICVANVVPIHAGFAPPLPELQRKEVKRRLLVSARFFSRVRTWRAIFKKRSPKT